MTLAQSLLWGSRIANKTKQNLKKKNAYKSNSTKSNHLIFYGHLDDENLHLCAYEGKDDHDLKNI